MGPGSEVEPLRRRDVLLAFGVTMVIVAVALLGDPGVRASFKSQEAIRPLLCRDELVVDVENVHGGEELLVPQGGLRVRVHEGDTNVSAKLTLLRKLPGEGWREAWVIGTPGGHEIFFLSDVRPGESAQVLADPISTDHCPARSTVLVAPE